jgi:hypothetical protein
VDAGRQRARLRCASGSLDQCLAQRASRLSESARRDCACSSAPRTRGHPGGTSRSTTTAWHAPSPPRPALTSCRLRRSARRVNFVGRGMGAQCRLGKKPRRARRGAERRAERAGRKRRQCQDIVSTRPWHVSPSPFWLKAHSGLCSFASLFCCGLEARGSRPRREAPNQARTWGQQGMHWLEFGAPARRACRDASSAQGLVGSAASCPLRARRLGLMPKRVHVDTAR